MSDFYYDDGGAHLPAGRLNYRQNMAFVEKKLKKLGGGGGSGWGSSKNEKPPVAAKKKSKTKQSQEKQAFDSNPPAEPRERSGRNPNGGQSSLYGYGYAALNSRALRERGGGGRGGPSDEPDSDAMLNLLGLSRHRPGGMVDPIPHVYDPEAVRADVSALDFLDDDDYDDDVAGGEGGGDRRHPRRSLQSKRDSARGGYGGSMRGSGDGSMRGSYGGGDGREIGRGGMGGGRGGDRGERGEKCERVEGGEGGVSADDHTGGGGGGPPQPRPRENFLGDDDDAVSSRYFEQVTGRMAQGLHVREQPGRGYAPRTTTTTVSAPTAAGASGLTGSFVVGGGGGGGGGASAAERVTLSRNETALARARNDPKVVNCSHLNGGGRGARPTLLRTVHRGGGCTR
jgi:hypothetical protein